MVCLPVGALSSSIRRGSKLLGPIETHVVAKFQGEIRKMRCEIIILRVSLNGQAT